MDSHFTQINRDVLPQIITYNPNVVASRTINKMYLQTEQQRFRQAMKARIFELFLSKTNDYQFVKLMLFYFHELSCVNRNIRISYGDLTIYGKDEFLEVNRDEVFNLLSNS